MVSYLELALLMAPSSEWAPNSLPPRRARGRMPPPDGSIMAASLHWRMARHRPPNIRAKRSSVRHPGTLHKMRVCARWLPHPKHPLCCRDAPAVYKNLRESHWIRRFV